MLEAAQHATGLTPNKARALLGRFLFSGEEAEKPLDGLSGGERRRLSLAILVHSGANVLILDEPTNHLDLESREALEEALRSSQGSLLLVSHDRALLDAVGTRTVAFEDQTLHSYVGGWPEYVRVREERPAGPAPDKPAGERSPLSPPASERVAPAAKPASSPTRPRAQRQPRAASAQAQPGRAAAARARDRGGRGGAAGGRGRARRSGRWSSSGQRPFDAPVTRQAKRAVEELYERWERVAG